MANFRRYIKKFLNVLFFLISYIQVTGGDDRLNAAYKGAIVMTGLSNFQELLINKEEWSNDRSEELFKRWNF